MKFKIGGLLYLSICFLPGGLLFGQSIDIYYFQNEPVFKRLHRLLQIESERRGSKIKIRPCFSKYASEKPTMILRSILLEYRDSPGSEVTTLSYWDLSLGSTNKITIKGNLRDFSALKIISHKVFDFIDSLSLEIAKKEFDFRYRHLFPTRKTTGIDKARISLWLGGAASMGYYFFDKKPIFGGELDLFSILPRKALFLFRVGYSGQTVNSSGYSGRWHLIPINLATGYVLIFNNFYLAFMGGFSLMVETGLKQETASEIVTRWNPGFMMGIRLSYAITRIFKMFFHIAYYQFVSGQEYYYNGNRVILSSPYYISAQLGFLFKIL